MADLNAALDRREEKYKLFGGGIETVPLRHRGTRKRSALTRTLAAGEAVAGVIRTTCERNRCPKCSHLIFTGLARKRHS